MDSSPDIPNEEAYKGEPQTLNFCKFPRKHLVCRKGTWDTVDLENQCNAGVATFVARFQICFTTTYIVV